MQARLVEGHAGGRGGKNQQLQKRQRRAGAPGRLLEGIRCRGREEGGQGQRGKEQRLLLSVNPLDPINDPLLWDVLVLGRKAKTDNAKVISPMTLSSREQL